MASNSTTCDMNFNQTSTLRLGPSSDYDFSRPQICSPLSNKQTDHAIKITNTSSNLSHGEQESRERGRNCVASTRWRYGSTSSTDSVFAAHDHPLVRSSWHSGGLDHQHNKHIRSK